MKLMCNVCNKSRCSYLQILELPCRLCWRNCHRVGLVAGCLLLDTFDDLNLFLNGVVVMHKANAPKLQRQQICKLAKGSKSYSSSKSTSIAVEDWNVAGKVAHCCHDDGHVGLSDSVHGGTDDRR